MTRNFARSAVAAFTVAFLLVAVVPVTLTGLSSGNGILGSRAEALDWKSKGRELFNKSKRGASRIKKSIQRKSRETYSRSRNKIEKYKKRIGNYGSKIKKKKNKARTTIKAYRKKAKQFTKRALERSRTVAKSIDRSRRNIMSGMPRGLSRRTMTALGSRLRNKVRIVTKRYGAVAGMAAANFLAKNKRAGSRILDRSRHVIKAAAAYSRDPRTRRRAVSAALIAVAMGYAVYRHQDDIKYAVASRALDGISVPVNGEMVSMNAIWTNAILQKAPYLKGTDIAEDPAKIIAYGLVGTAGEDLVNHLEIVPDGKGGVSTVAQTIERSDSGSAALVALQFQSTMEGAGMEAVRSGRLGPNGKLFATAYYDVSTRIESSAR